LVSTAQVAAGQNVVVLGAAGGVGSAAVGVAKALGARVIAGASTPEKRNFCLSVGADEAVDYTSGDFKDIIKRMCKGGADVVLDLVGGDASEQAMRATSHGGRFIVIGFASGVIPKIALNLPLLKGFTIAGYEIADFERRHPQEADANRHVLEAMVADGRVAPPITARYPLDEAAAALRRVAGREKFGITILDVAAQRE
jgi:NADPH2:quinone reductase